MDKLKAVIVDDDPLNIVDLKEYLKPHLEQIEIVNEFQDGYEACEYINNSKPDLAFLDIEMPGLNGFQMLSYLHHSPIIIFVTAHSKYALKSFDYSPADFLLKPVEPLKLSRAIGNAVKDYSSRNNAQRLVTQQKISGHLPIHYKDEFGITRYPFIEPTEILFIRTCPDDSHHIELYTDDGKTHGPIRQSLSQFRKHLDSLQFVYVYKNMIANYHRFVELIDNKYLVLKGQKNVRVEVSRRHKKTIKQLLLHKQNAVR